MRLKSILAATGLLALFAVFMAIRRLAQQQGRRPPHAGVRELPRDAVERDRPLAARREERRQRQHVPGVPRRRRAST